MRLAATLALGTLLAGCATGGDRVTLLSAENNGEPVGAVVVNPDTDPVELNMANQQAVVSANRTRVTQLESPDPEHVELMRSLPPGWDGLVLTGFASGDVTLDSSQERQVEAHMCKIDWREKCEEYYPDCGDEARRGVPPCPVARPGYQVEIRGYTDAVGSAEVNLRVSQDRADAVAAILSSNGYTIAQEDVLGMGEDEAIRALGGDERGSEDWRRVDIVIR